MGSTPRSRSAWPSGARTTGVCARPADAGDSTRWPTEGSMRTIEVIPAEGILLIGDPHLSSRRPGRRSTYRELSDGHALSLLAEAGTLYVLSGDGSPDLLVSTELSRTGRRS